MNSHIILCTGGTRSGKSEFAEKLALSLNGKKAYIATSQIYDEEMSERVNRHKERRKNSWLNYEIPFDLSTNWPKIENDGDIFLLDCITMYITNQLLTYDLDKSQNIRNEAEGKIVGDIENFMDIFLQSQDKTLIIVTNELGLGIVPENILGRVFRDIVGLVNQKIAQKAEKVFFTISGITIDIKNKEVSLNG